MTSIPKNEKAMQSKKKKKNKPIEKLTLLLPNA